MKRYSAKSYEARSRGFTLVEVSIVLAVIGILVAIAYPSYLHQVTKSRRADAQTTLLETAQALERCYTENNDYRNCIDGGFPFQSEDGWYEINGRLTRTQFTLRATAQDIQQDRDAHLCAWLELSHTGRQTAEDSGGNDTTETCWGD